MNVPLAIVEDLQPDTQVNAIVAHNGCNALFPAYSRVAVEMRCGSSREDAACAESRVGPAVAMLARLAGGPR